MFLFATKTKNGRKIEIDFCANTGLLRLFAIHSITLNRLEEVALRHWIETTMPQTPTCLKDDLDHEHLSNGFCREHSLTYFIRRTITPVFTQQEIMVIFVRSESKPVKLLIIW